MPGVVGVYLLFIVEMDVCNGITLQNGGICLHVNIGQLPVVEEQVRRNVQGKGSVRELLFQGGTLVITGT